jgi:sortase A
VSSGSTGLVAIAILIAAFLLLYLALGTPLGDIGVLGWIIALVLVVIVAEVAFSLGSRTRRELQPRLRTRAGSRSLRFLADVAMTGGLLLLIEAGVTLLWQEPLSALLASRAQADLEAELEESTRPSTDGDLATLAARHRRQTGTGDPLGTIRIRSIDVSFTIVEGTDEGSLRKGPGHYVSTPLPGQPGTFGLAGHRTTYLAPFRDIDDLRRDDGIVIRMPYGRFEYTVEGSRSVDPSQVSVLRRVNHDRIVLTACHPLYSATERIVVHGRLSQLPGFARSTRR